MTQGEKINNVSYKRKNYPGLPLDRGCSALLALVRSEQCLAEGTVTQEQYRNHSATDLHVT